MFDMEIPEHLLGRSRAARVRAHLAPGGSEASAPMTGADPFLDKRASQEAARARLLDAKASLLTAVQPVRRLLETGARADLSGQFMSSDSLHFGASFTPRAHSDTDVFLTLYGDREVFGEVQGGKAYRAGEQRAWRMPVAKNTLGATLKSAGQRPIRDALKLGKGDVVTVENGDVTAELAALVMGSAAVERITNSVTLFEGSADRQGYRASYGKRYAVSVSATRNPADTPEGEGIFGVDLLSLNGRSRVDEGQPYDGSRLEGERAVMSLGGSLFYNRPTQLGLASSLTATEHAMGAFVTLIADPTQTNAIATYRVIDSHLR